MTENSITISETESKRLQRNAYYRARAAKERQRIAESVERTGRYPINRRLLRRIFAKISVSTIYRYNGSPCWEWTGYIGKNGYGTFNICTGIHHPAHRVTYQMFVAAVTDDLQCDHLCRVRHCVNPAHLEAVTPRVNQTRGGHRLKTHCKNSHEFAGYNVVWILARSGYPTRTCRACRNLWRNQYRKNKKQHK